MFKIGTLDQIAEITMGQSPKGSTVSAKGNMPLLNGPSEFGTNNPRPVQFTSNPIRLAKKGDLLFCVRGSTGKMNWADREYAIGRGLAAIRPKDKKSKYFIKESIEFFLKELISGATGSVFSSINKNQLHKMKCFIPDDTSLKNVNKVFSDLSNKIETNRQMNKILYEITKTIYKSWFKDFDQVNANADEKSTSLSKEIKDIFPNSFEDTINGRIPKNWNYKSIYEELNVVYGAPFSSEKFNSESKGIPIIRIRDLKKQTSDIFTEEIHPRGVMIEQGDVVVGMDGEFRPYLWSGEKAWMNQRIGKFVPKKDLSSTFIIETLREQLKFIELTEVATTVIHLSKSDIDKFIILEGNNGVRKLFDKFANQLKKKL